MADDWDGEWWAEALEGKALERYTVLVKRLREAKPDDRAHIAREIFQLGHEHGYELARVGDDF